MPDAEEKKSVEADRLIGDLDPFVIGEQDFNDYLIEVDNYFALNKITDDEFKVRLLINKIGSTACKKIINALKPKVFSEEKYVDVVKVCKGLFGEQKNEVAQQFRFMCRVQRESESLVDYAVELQALAEECNFGDFLDKALRSRFISGLRNKHTRNACLKLKAETKFKETVEHAKNDEFSYQQAIGMKKDSESETVNYMRGQNRHGMRSGSDKSGKSDRGGSHMRSRGGFSRGGGNSGGIKCYNCDGFGHFAKYCPSEKVEKRGGQARGHGRGVYRTDGQPYRTNTIAEPLDDVTVYRTKSEEELLERIGKAVGESISDIECVSVCVENAQLQFELDTGSRISLISERDYEKHLSHKKIFKTELPFGVITGHKIDILGETAVEVRAKGKMLKLRIFVVRTNVKFMPLMGREWIEAIFPSWREIFQVHKVEQKSDSLIQMRRACVEKLVKKFTPIFDNDLSVPIKDIVADIKMNENAKPVIFKPYNVPFNLREKVEKEIDEKVKAGILEKVEYPVWASPMVVVRKPNGDIRCCLDGSRTINPHIQTHHYPLPVIDELLANKSDAKWFCALDLKGAYTQLVVNENTSQVLGISTIKGTYRFKRLPFGVKPAASIFQAAMDKILSGINNVQVYIDDVLIWAKDIAELYMLVKMVLQRLMDYNVKVNLEKCQWFVNEVTYLGHRICDLGILPNNKKIEPILNAPVPKNVSELKSFLGMVNFYSKFIDKLNLKLNPLHQLLHKGAEWVWSDECQRAFEFCKKELSSEKVLTHYDPRKKIIVTCDASDQGISGILSHCIDGDEKPVLFVSRSLTTAEKRYPILHREALAIVFAMEKFYKYVYGHHVEIFTDHKPLVGVFHAKKGEPPVIATRLQRYVIRLSIFDYTLTHRKGKENGNADALSRLPIEGVQSDEDKWEEKINSVEKLMGDHELVLDVERIRVETQKDLNLREIMICVLKKWKNDGLNKKLRHYYSKKELLSVEMGCLVYDGRIVIPTALIVETLRILHTNHLGISKMKVMARKFVYWQGINSDIENFVQGCESCQIFQKNNQKKLYGEWAETSQPMERVHIDFLSYKGKTFLIFIDAFSRWLEIKLMNSMTAAAVIKELQKIFNFFGYCTELVCDNGPPFSSYEFKEYLKSKGIIYTNSPTYHPQSNGLVERAVQTTKSVIRKLINDSKTHLQMVQAMDTFVNNYRNLPCTAENFIPAHRMFSFEPRIGIKNVKYDKRIDYEACAKSLNEYVKEVVEDPRPKIENKSKQNYENVELNEIKKFVSDEEVWYRNTNSIESHRAKIIKQKSKHVYLVQIGSMIKLAHVNQLRKYMPSKFVYSNPTTDEKSKLFKSAKKKKTPKKHKSSEKTRQSKRNRPAEGFFTRFFKY